MSLFGENELAIRLPEIFGFWLMSVCIFLFVRQHGSTLCAAAAMLFPLSTKAYTQYAIEARAYALVLGFGALAALCWQQASDSPSRRTRIVAALMFWVALMAALCSHYYSVLLLIPFGVGELVRWWRTGRLNLPLSTALVASLLPFIPLYPALKRGSTFITHFVKASSTFWAKPSPSQVPLFYMEFLNGVLPPLFLAAVIILVFQALGRKETESRMYTSRLPLHEVAMAVTLAALPVFALAIGVLATGSYIDRYAISAVIGCSILFGFITIRASRAHPPVVLIAVIVSFFGWFLLNGVHKPSTVKALAAPQLAGVDVNEPVVVSDPLEFIKLFHYAPKKFVSRMHYISDIPTAVQMPDFVPELALDELVKWMPVPVEKYTNFVAEHDRFAVYYNSEPTLEWLPSKLVADGKQVDLISQTNGVQIFQVSTKAK